MFPIASIAKVSIINFFNIFSLPFRVAFKGSCGSLEVHIATEQRANHAVDRASMAIAKIPTQKPSSAWVEEEERAAFADTVTGGRGSGGRGRRGKRRRKLYRLGNAQKSIHLFLSLY